MPKSKRISPAREPFGAVAQRLGDALADVLEHPDCPATVADAVCEMDTQIFNQCNDVAISLRHSFPYRLVAALEQEAA